MHNMCLRMKEGNLTKVELLLLIGAILSTTIVYGLGVIGTFSGIYKN